MPRRPCLLDVYGTAVAMPSVDAIEQLLTIAPPFPFITRAAACAAKNGPLRFVSTIRSQRSSATSGRGADLLDASVVDENVEPAERRRRILDDLLHGGDIEHVHRERRHRRDAECRRFGEAGHVSGGDGNPRARGGQTQCQRPTDAAAGAMHRR